MFRWLVYQATLEEVRVGNNLVRTLGGGGGNERRQCSFFRIGAKGGARIQSHDDIAAARAPANANASAAVPAAVEPSLPCQVVGRFDDGQVRLCRYGHSPQENGDIIVSHDSDGCGPNGNHVVKSLLCDDDRRMGQRKANQRSDSRGGYFDDRLEEQLE